MTLMLAMLACVFMGKHWALILIDTVEAIEPEVIYVTPEPAIEPAAMRAVVATDEEAEAVARVLYGMRYNTKEDLQAVVWCIINRVESQIYPSTVVEVCEQPSQWIGYSETNPVVDNLYDIAHEALDTWRSGGHRPFGSEYLWFNWSSEQITFKTSFEEGKSCRYWRAQ